MAMGISQHLVEQVGELSNDSTVSVVDADQGAHGLDPLNLHEPHGTGGTARPPKGLRSKRVISDSGRWSEREIRKSVS